MRKLLYLVMLLWSNSALSNTFDITLITAASEERINVGQSFAGITVEVHRPIRRAVELALFESSTLFNTLGIQPAIHQLVIGENDDIKQRLSSVPSSSLYLLDIPLSMMERVATIADELSMVSVNVRHSETYLRDQLCLKHLVHTIPSDQMYFDALGQFLVFRGWRKVLVIRGPTARDQERAISLTRSLKKFGATIEAERVFTLSHHPDDRDKNKPEFLTGGISYDVVAVIDSSKDYGRYLQYSTRRARPVVGDVGLTPASWHFSLERYGAPQLNERYRTFKPSEKLGPQASMTDAEFAAWSAVKLVTNSLNSRQKEKDIALPSILEDPTSQVDLYKGTRGSIRQWNNQLRQPILLATQDAVIAIAPMPKFLHPNHYVDTLGLDKPESECQLR